MQFVKDVKNVSSTRKFWVGLGGAVGSAVLVYLSNFEEFAPVLAVLTALGVYQIRNK